jgi:eukaryotic-like serine/threonine-protein kinase
MKGLAAVGDVLAGKYRVDKILGIGGMGMVVAATHLEIDQRVALKFMLPGGQDSPESSARFLREARAAGRLNSEHVCRVMDVGRFDSGAPYIVMEYLQGENLGAVLRRRGPLRVSEAVDYILQGIEGLAEAHAHGIIHRDLKPDNLFLHKRNDGGASVKVLDFGISKISIAGLSTKTGDIMGSPAYMAPEQMESTRNVDHRADVWSLGVVLYQLVAGKAPFHGDTLPLLCLHVVNDEPTPMSEIRADLPDGFEDVVMKCLRKEPPERYADVGELAQALAPFGPKNANTSASRIQIVLRRTKTDSASVISTEFSTVAPEELAPARALPAGNREATTFSATAGQSMSTARVERPSRVFPVAIVLALGAAALALVVWRGGNDLGGAAGKDPPPTIAKPSQGIDPPPPPPRQPPPIVEPILDDPPQPQVTPPHPDVTPPHPDVTPPHPDVTPPQHVADPVTPSRPDPKRHKPPRRPPGRPGSSRPGVRAGSAGGRPVLDAGSAAEPPPDPPPDDDDKWTHMTHDGKQ